MSDSYLMTPAGESSPYSAAVLLYLNSLAPPSREQAHDTAASATLNDTGTADVKGPEPARVRLDGRFKGTDAETMADRLRDNFIADPEVTEIDLQRKDGSGNDVPDEFNGRYAFDAEASTVRPAHPQRRTLYEYRVVLAEV
jgi:hypothetical protein